MMRFICALSVLLVGAIPARAVPEADFAKLHRTVLLPYHQQYGVRGSMKGVDGVRIDTVRFEGSGNVHALVIVNGRTESHLKYAEIFYDLRDWGYALYSYDHRGQGMSERLLSNHSKQYVDRFDDYVEDFRTFIQTVVRRTSHGKVFVLAHSMGGLVATRLAEKHPDLVDAYVLNAPAHRFSTDPFPEPVAFGLGLGGTALFQGEEYAPGNKDRAYEPFDTNICTSSQTRYDAHEQMVTEDSRMGMGGVTYKWVRETFTATQRARHEARRFQAPVLILQAGDERVVKNDGQDAVCRLARDCRLVKIANAKHEILMERDEMRDHGLAEIRAFLDEQRDAPPWQETMGCSSTRAPQPFLLLAVFALVLWSRARSRSAER